MQTCGNPWQHIPEVDVAVVDIDGLLAVGDTPIRGARRFVRTLHEMVRFVVFATNDSRRTTKQQLDRLHRVMGMPVDPRVLVTSIDSTLAELRTRGHRSIATFGTAALGVEAARSDFELDGREPTAVVTASADVESDVDMMVSRVSALVRAGAEWLSTNDDLYVPSSAGPILDAGWLIESIQGPVEVAPVICGKPHHPMTVALAETLDAGGFSLNDRLLVIGDNPDTDMRWAQSLQATGLLVSERDYGVRNQPFLQVSSLESLLQSYDA